MKWTKAERAENRARAIELLHEWLEPGARVYVTCAHVARSGMSRDLRFFIVRNGEILNVTWHVAWATDKRIAERDGSRVLRIGGCGMDMGFAVVYDLGRVLYPKGGPLRKSPREHQERRAGKRAETDGGYLLRSEWL